MKKITGYHDLVAEKAHVQQKLALLKRDMHAEIDEIKQRFRPITRIVELVTGNGSSKSPDSDSGKGNLLKMGAALGVDLLVGPRLAKAGLITRMIVPPILRNISKNLINRFRRKK